MKLEHLQHQWHPMGYISSAWHVWRRLNCKFGVDGLYEMWKQDNPHGSILKLFFHTRERALAAALVLVACFVTFK